MKKHYAPDFYTQKRASHYTYHYKPPGQFDVARFVTGGKPYWGRDTTVDKEERKAIIISDWTAPYWSEEKRTNVVFSLHQFIEDGFQIYYWNQDALCVLNDPEIFFDQRVRDKITFISEESLKSAALEQYRLLSKQVIIIDYHALPLLLGQERIPKHCMLSDDLITIKLKKNEITIMHPDFSEIWVNKDWIAQEISSPYNFPNVKLTKTKQQNHHYSLLFDHIMATDEAMVMVQQKSPPELRLLLKKSITDQDIKNIEAMSCYTKCLKIEQNFMPGGQPKTKDAKHAIDVGILFDALDWTQLEKFSIMSVGIPCRISNDLKKLRSIYLSSTTPITSKKNQLIELNFPYIRELELFIMNGYCLSSLSSCLNLKKLTAKYLSVEKIIDLFVGDFLLENLTEIDIIFDGICTNIISLLSKIKHCAPNLKKITLSLKMMDEMEYMYLDALESVNHDFFFSDEVSANLTFYRFPFKVVALISNFFHHIKTLDITSRISNKKTKHADLFTPIFGLKKLKSICLNTSEINSERFNSLVSNSNELQSIKITSCDKLDDLFLINLSLFQLEEILVHDCPCITYAAFDSLFSDQNSIKKIDFDIMRYSNGYEQSNLMELNTIEISHIDPIALFHLTKHSKKIKSINLSCGNINALQVIKNILKNNQSVNNLVLRIDKDNGLVDDELTEINKKIFSPMIIDHPYDESEDQYSDDKSSSRRSKKKSANKFVDLNTEQRERTFHIQQIFRDKSSTKIPELSRYRLQAFNDVKFKSGQFLLKNTGSISLIAAEKKEPLIQKKSNLSVYSYMQSIMDEDLCMGTLLGEKSPFDDALWLTENPTHHVGQQSFYIGQQSFNGLTEKWEPIASLYPDETLIHWATTPHREIEIKYSTRDSLHYIRSIEGAVSFVLDFEIAHAPRLIPPTLNPTIQSVMEYFKQFSSGALDRTHLKTLSEAVEAIMTAKVGACRHRAVAFFCYLKENFPTIPVRIISNDCHMYVEVCQNDTWITCDLGGYPGKIHAYESPSHAIEAALAIESMPERPMSPLREAMDYSVNPALEAHISEQLDRQLISSKQATHYDSLENYISTLLTGEHATQRIDLPRHFLLRFHLSLKKQAQRAGHPVFYVHSPDQLVCSHAFIRLNRDGSGKACSGPGGALHAFLTQFDKTYAGPSPILIINYTTFTEEEIASWNHVLSEPRRTDTTDLPPSLILLGLFDPSLVLNYDPSDFDFRFQTVQNAPDYLLDKREFTDPSDTPADDLPIERTQIQLYHSPNWQNLLLDHWILKDGKLQLEPGKLSLALQSKRPIEIQNAPIDENFSRFWALTSLELPADKPIFFTNGYQWDWNIDQVEQTITPDLNALILNPSQLSQFIKPYKLKGNQLSQESGWIADHANGTLCLYITRDLSEDEWGIFYNEYKKHPNIRLSFACAKNIAPPPGWNAVSLEITQDIIPQALHTQWIWTNDMDLALESISDLDEWTLLDISECQSSDLLTQLTCTDKESYYFVEETKALLHAMRCNKKMILTGDFSDMLMDDLAVFLVDRLRRDTVTGQLLLISEKPFPYLTPTSRHFFTWEDKRKVLSSQFPSVMLDKKPDAFRSLSFIQQKSALTFECRHPGQSYIGAWDGLKSLHAGTRLIPFDPKTCLKDASDFNIRRTHAFETALQNACYVVITGLTGVGKTTFVQDYFKEALHQGADASTLIAWATHRQTEGVIPLFIDESNLLHRDWSEFEGLFQPKPHVLIDGTIYPVTQNHRVIFAGNPLSYSDDRMLARLFDRHGHSLVFEPLSTAFIYENIIKPIFSGKPIDSSSQELIGTTLLGVYQFIIESSEDSVLISPREVQMMTLLVVQDICQASTILSLRDIENIARHHAYSIGKHLVLTQKRSSFDRLFKPAEGMDMTFKDWADSNFIYTESRLIVKKALCDYFALRAHRQQHDRNLNDPQRYGGLGALVIEGSTGVGKTALVEDVLSHLRLRNGRDYLVIQPSIAFDKKRELLLNAFDNGQIVIMNEMNTSSMMEQLLNCLLMGTTPAGTRPLKPGFLIIGIQKSAATAGRQLPSNALARRIQTCYLPPYEDHELDYILNKKGVVDAEQRAALIAVYNRKQNPKPTFAHLMHVTLSYLSKKRPTEANLEETGRVSRSRNGLWGYHVPTDLIDKKMSTPGMDLSR